MSQCLFYLFALGDVTGYAEYDRFPSVFDDLATDLRGNDRTITLQMNCLIEKVTSLAYLFEALRRAFFASRSSNILCGHLQKLFLAVSITLTGNGVDIVKLTLEIMDKYGISGAVE